MKYENLRKNSNDRNNYFVSKNDILNIPSKKKCYIIVTKYATFHWINKKKMKFL